MNDAVDVDRDVGRRLAQEVEDGDARSYIAADGVDPHVDLAIGSFGSYELTDDILGADIGIVADFAVQQDATGVLLRPGNDIENALHFAIRFVQN